MTMSQKLPRSYIEYLKPINRLALGILRAQWPFDFIDGEETTQSFLFIRVAHEETYVGVGTVIAGATEDYRAEGEADCGTEMSKWDGELIS
jgi:hypothetical protein